MPVDGEVPGGARSPANGPLGTPARLPLVFLDVDGVLNPYAWSGHRPGAFTDFEPRVARGFPLLLSRAMGARLRALPAEICWATTWSESIDVDISPYVGLPAGLRVAAHLPAEPDVAASNWKLVQVRALVEREMRPFAWIDDDALDAPGPDGRTAREWADDLAVAHLLIAPRAECGLTPAQLDDLEAWLSEATLRCS